MTTRGLRILARSSAPARTEPSDGVSLISASEPPGLTELLAEAIVDGRLGYVDEHGRVHVKHRCPH